MLLIWKIVYGYAADYFVEFAGDTNDLQTMSAINEHWYSVYTKVAAQWNTLPTELKTVINTMC